MKSILLIGVGSFGKLIAKQIHELGHQVMAIDKDEDRINEVLPYVTNALIGDSTNESFLNSIGINNFDVCINYFFVQNFPCSKRNYVCCAWA